MQGTLYPTLLCTVLLGYFVISKLVFDKVYLTSKIVIDEEFHTPQGISYCNFTFDTWNPKITTLPGLYIVSAIILGPINLCSIYWLRFVNLLASVLNLWLFYICFKLFSTKQTPTWVYLLSSINLAILPPLYFFSHLYYTDVVSTTFILLLVICNKTGNHGAASVFGMMSIFMRQTNIIWVVMVFGQYCLREVVNNSEKHIKKLPDGETSIKNTLSALWDLRSGKIFKKLTLNLWLNVFVYVAVLLSFALFVIVNGSIVVGDKTAHTASIHIPQLFYFALFCLVFAWPYFATDITHFLKFVHKSKIITLIVLIFCTLIVFLNTLEHAYLLADNRHYTFYIWNRFYRKYFWFRYVMIPVYYFGFFGLISKLQTQYNSSFILTYFFCTSLVLIPQKMIELRYFLIPYILFRFQMKNVKLWQLISELVFYCALNVLAFYIFFTKDIYWSDFSDVQKLIW